MQDEKSGKRKQQKKLLTAPDRAKNDDNIIVAMA